MNNAIVVKRKYYEFFKWHGYYSFHGTSERRNTDPICEFCALLNNEEKRTATTIHRHTSEWWNQSTLMYNLPACRTKEPIESGPQSNHDKLDPLTVINTIKDELVNVIPDLLSSIK